MIARWIVPALLGMHTAGSAGPARRQDPPRTTHSAPCEPSRYAGDGTVPAIPRLPSPGCPVDGDVIVLALDSSRVLVATRDSSEAAVIGAAYTVFITLPGAVPRNLAWSSRAGHALNNGNADFFVASADPSVQPVALEFSEQTRVAHHPDALTIMVRSIVIVERSTLSWDILSRLSTAARCAPEAGDAAPGEPLRGRSIAGLDGSRISLETAVRAHLGDCFVVDGRQVRLK